MVYNSGGWSGLIISTLHYCKKTMKKEEMYLLKVTASRTGGMGDDIFDASHYLVEDGEEPEVDRDDEWWYYEMLNLARNNDDEIEESRWGQDDVNAEYSGEVVLHTVSDRRYKDGVRAWLRVAEEE
jgi:hypothetical protein